MLERGALTEMNEQLVEDSRPASGRRPAFTLWGAFDYGKGKRRLTGAPHADHDVTRAVRHSMPKRQHSCAL